MKHSIFLKINIIFITSIISLFVIFSLTSYIKQENETKKIFFKASTILKVLHRFNQDELEEYLHHQDLEIVKLAGEIQNNGQVLIPNEKEKNFDNSTCQFGNSDVTAIIYNNELYYDVTTDANSTLIIKDNEYGKSSFNYLLYIYFAVFIILVIIYFLLINSLNPLKQLQKEIIKFGNGNLDIDTKTDAKDEIASVANEFDKAVQKIKNLNSARALFLRNIMHELKTPITKGKLCVSLIDDEDNTKILTSVFDRLELLINEMADIERVSADETILNKKDYRILDILDNAIDLLFVDKNKINHNISNEIINGDFKLLTIVFKNLIDNAIKYSQEQSINISVDNNTKELFFISTGDEIKHFDKMLEPFNKIETTKNNQKGFGLGLYIINQILLKHHFKLKYDFQDKKNVFIINY